MSKGQVPLPGPSPWSSDVIPAWMRRKGWSSHSAPRPALRLLPGLQREAMFSGSLAVQGGPLGGFNGSIQSAYGEDTQGTASEWCWLVT